MFRIVPKILYFDTFTDFYKACHLGHGDLLNTNRWIYDPYIRPLDFKIPVIFQEEYGKGEPSDKMIDAMAKDMAAYLH